MPELLEHRVPKDAKVVAPSSCTCCGRDLYVNRGRRVLCQRCADTFEIGNQVWVSTCCDRARKWGELQPHDKVPKMLSCANCGEVSQHVFLEVVGMKS